MAHEKKAEDILIKYCPVFDPLFADAATHDHKTRIMKAMFEFANYMVDLNTEKDLENTVSSDVFQYTLDEVVKLRSELIEAKTLLAGQMEINTDLGEACGDLYNTLDEKKKQFRKERNKRKKESPK